MTGLQMAEAQTLSEKLLRESPDLSFNIGLAYEGNTQKTSSYDNQQLGSITVSPRYKVSENYTAIGRVGFTQSYTQDNRSDMTNTSLGFTRKPIPIGTIADLRPTLSLILPTNSQQRYRDSLLGGAQFTASAFFRTHTRWILGLGTRFRQNFHEFTISSVQGANIETLMQPFLTVGISVGKFQFATQSSYTLARTYRGTVRQFFSGDQSITYIPSRELSFSLGHNNQGSLLTQDGQSSNVDLFDRRRSIFYFSAVLNY